MTVCPLTLREARAFVREHHRHHEPPAGGLFAIGAEDEGAVVAVAIVGRPVARMLQDDYTAEVVRLCSTGARNACSLLYSACWRAARAMGYRRLVTYTLPEEGGASLRAAGWRCVGEAGGGLVGPEGTPASRHPPDADEAPMGGSVRAGAALGKGPR